MQVPLRHPNICWPALAAGVRAILSPTRKFRAWGQQVGLLDLRQQASCLAASSQEVAQLVVSLHAITATGTKPGYGHQTYLQYHRKEGKQHHNQRQEGEDEAAH